MENNTYFETFINHKLSNVVLATKEDQGREGPGRHQPKTAQGLC